MLIFFSREGSWGFAGVNAFTMDTSGLLQPANVFECILELHETSAGYSATLAANCSPETPSLYNEGAWSDNLFLELTGKDIYMPQFDYLRGSDRGAYMTDFYHRFAWDGDKFRYKQLEYNPVLAKYLPEPGWLVTEFEWGESIIRIDSVADGGYRYIQWKRDDMFSSAPEHVLTKGRYDESKHEYHFQNGDYEYVFNTALERLQILYTDPETKKVEVVRSYGGND